MIAEVSREIRVGKFIFNNLITSFFDSAWKEAIVGITSSDFTTPIKAGKEIETRPFRRRKKESRSQAVSSMLFSASISGF
ncbi:hypothetical protein PSY31_23255, partial [Shigella flexneri]|nr:hypothetical protein [Shigella flexneri]